MFTLIVVLALTLAGCGGKEGTAAPTEPASAPAATAAPAAKPTEPEAAPEEATSEPEPTAEPSAAPAATPEEEALSLDTRDAGLNQLKSYRLTWHAEWKSTDQGKEEAGAWDWIEEYTSDPKASYLSMSTPDANDPAKNTAFEVWRIGDTSYMKSGEEGKCVSYSTEGAESDIQNGAFNPSMLGSINDAKYVGRETVNGIPTKHYEYDAKTGVLTGRGEVKGETWIAIDGGYVVKDTVTWKGGGGFFGLGSDTATGEGSWTWELSDVNKALEIVPPEGCGGEQLDLPMMPVVKEKTRFGDMISYKTVGTVAEAAKFYKNELPAAGWKLEGEPTEMGDVVMLNYTKDALNLSVMISGSEGDIAVIMNVTK
jgi:hypothetical protein